MRGLGADLIGEYVGGGREGKGGSRYSGDIGHGVCNAEYDDEVDSFVDSALLIAIDAFEAEAQRLVKTRVMLSMGSKEVLNGTKVRAGIDPLYGGGWTRSLRRRAERRWMAVT